MRKLIRETREAFLASKPPYIYPNRFISRKTSRKCNSRCIRWRDSIWRELVPWESEKNFVNKEGTFKDRRSQKGSTRWKETSFSRSFEFWRYKRPVYLFPRIYLRRDCDFLRLSRAPQVPAHPTCTYTVIRVSTLKRNRRICARGLVPLFWILFYQ